MAGFGAENCGILKPFEIHKNDLETNQTGYPTVCAVSQCSSKLITDKLCRQQYTQTRLRQTALPIAIGDIGKINTLWSRHNGRHFPYDIVKWIFLNGNLGISMKISLKFVPKGPINNIHIGLDNGLAPTRRQAVIWMNDG